MSDYLNEQGALVDLERGQFVQPPPSSVWAGLSQRWSPGDWVLVISSYLVLFTAYAWPFLRLIVAAHGWQGDWIVTTTTYWYYTALFGMLPAVTIIFVFTFAGGWTGYSFVWRLAMFFIYLVMVVPPMWLSIVSPNLHIDYKIVHCVFESMATVPLATTAPEYLELGPF